MQTRIDKNRFTRGCGMMLIMLLLIYSFKKVEVDPRDQEVQIQTVISSSTLVKTSTPKIAISNFEDKSIEVYDYKNTVWNTGTREWAFTPTPELGYRKDAIAAIGDGIADMRWHTTNGFPNRAQSAFVIQGGRYLGLGIYTPAGDHRKGEMLWEHVYPVNEDPNNHAIELLPNGNVAVAGFGDASNTSPYGNWVRIYNTLDPSGASYAETFVIGPHSLLFDSVRNRLWVAGQLLIDGKTQHGVFAYEIGGTREMPLLTEDTSLRAMLPYGNPMIPSGIPDKLKFPHDLAPDYDNENLMYYGDHTGVYVFDKSTKIFTAAPGASHLYQGKDIALKSCGKQAGGYYFATYAYNRDYKYTTNKVEFFDPVTGALAMTKTVSGFTIYRAKIWSNSYQ